MCRLLKWNKNRYNRPQNKWIDSGAKYRYHWDYSVLTPNWCGYE